MAQPRPLYYVGSGQLNVQIPYETTANSSAVLSVNNNGQVTTQSFQVASAAPGIFTDSTGALVPTAAAARGQEIAFYIDGAGAVSPAIPTGAAPAASHGARGPSKPVQPTSVTIGGATANIDFIGIPSGLAGVTQINRASSDRDFNGGSSGGGGQWGGNRQCCGENYDH